MLNCGRHIHILKCYVFRPREERKGLSIIDAMELARVYEELVPTETCFKLENVLHYVSVIEKENAELKKENSHLKKGFYCFKVVFIARTKYEYVKHPQISFSWVTPRLWSCPPFHLLSVLYLPTLWQGCSMQ